MELGITELNKNISGVLAKAKGEDLVIVKHGKPVAVLVDHSRYQKLIAANKQQFANISAYDFFKTLPKVDDFEIIREDFKMRDIAL